MMKLAKFRVVGVALLGVMITSGCSNMQLEEENALLNQRVVELEQVKSDYADKLTSVQQLSDADKEQFQQELNAMRADLTQKLDSQIQENEVLLAKIDSLTVITLGEASIFGSGLSDLSEEGVKTINQIAEVFAQYPDYHIRVEGHTDSVPLSDELKARYPSNWELSAARASSVIRYMIYGLKMAPERLSTTGYAHYRPVADNETKEGRSQNRRIRVVVFKDM